MDDEPAVGDVAPDFRLRTAEGREVQISDYRGEKNLVLFFYPKDNSPGCTIEAKGFRDNHDAFRDMDAEVFGISTDSPESHRSFAERCDLPYPLLVDEDKHVSEAYDARRFLGLLTARKTFVIDKDGIIRHIYASMNPDRHVPEALKAVREIEVDREPSTVRSR